MKRTRRVLACPGRSRVRFSQPRPKDESMPISQRVVGAISVALAMAMITGGCTKKDEAPPSTSGGASSSAEAGGKIKVAFVPKLQGSPYFEAMDTGAKQAAADLG